MTKLEDVFNLPKRSGLDQDTADDATQALNSIDEIKLLMDEVDKINAALPQVRNIETVDYDLDKYAAKSVEAFDELVELGKNVDDRNCAAIFDSATKMLQNAITAKTVKANKQLDMIRLQISNAKLEHDREKLEFAKEKYKADTSDSPAISGETLDGIVARRSDLIGNILDDLGIGGKYKQ